MANRNLLSSTNCCQCERVKSQVRGQRLAAGHVVPRHGARLLLSWERLGSAMQQKQEVKKTEAEITRLGWALSRIGPMYCASRKKTGKDIDVCWRTVYGIDPRDLLTRVRAEIERQKIERADRFRAVNEAWELREGLMKQITERRAEERRSKQAGPPLPKNPRIFEARVIGARDRLAKRVQQVSKLAMARGCSIRPADIPVAAEIVNAVHSQLSEREQIVLADSRAAELKCDALLDHHVAASLGRFEGMGNCRNCGHWFDGDNKRKRYCSDACSVAFRNRKKAGNEKPSADISQLVTAERELDTSHLAKHIRDLERARKQHPKDCTECKVKRPCRNLEAIESAHLSARRESIERVEQEQVRDIQGHRRGGKHPRKRTA
jgi:hypothetical protein